MFKLYDYYDKASLEWNKLALKLDPSVKNTFNRNRKL